MGGRWPTADFRESRSFQRLQSSNFRPTRIGRTPFRNFQSFRIALSRVSLGSTDDRVMADCCSTRMHRFVLCFVICRGQPDHGARAGWETTSSQPVMGDFGSIINTAQELVQHRRARCEPTRARDRASACSFAPIVGASDLACLDLREPSGRQPVPRVLFRMAITLSLFVYRVRSMYLSRSEEKSFSWVVFPGCIFL